MLASALQPSYAASALVPIGFGFRFGMGVFISPMYQTKPDSLSIFYSCSVTNVQKMTESLLRVVCVCLTITDYTTAALLCITVSDVFGLIHILQLIGSLF